MNVLWEASPRAGSGQVFVDDSGRRRRWIRGAGSVVTVACALYVGIVAVGLSQTAVGPLEAVPAGGNGEIAGFPDSSGTVPGLLQFAGSAARPVDRGARVPAATKQIASTPRKSSAKSNVSAKKSAGLTTQKVRSSDSRAAPRAT